MQGDDQRKEEYLMRLRKRTPRRCVIMWIGAHFEWIGEVFYHATAQ